MILFPHFIYFSNNSPQLVSQYTVAGAGMHRTYQGVYYYYFFSNFGVWQSKFEVMLGQKLVSNRTKLRIILHYVRHSNLVLYNVASFRVRLFMGLRRQPSAIILHNLLLCYYY